MAEYDPVVIRKFADRLYSRAATIEVVYSLVGGLFGGGLGYAVMINFHINQPFLLILGFFLLGALGYAIGNQRAFLLRLQAQTALCQVQIEENTHPPSTTHPI